MVYSVRRRLNLLATAHTCSPVQCPFISFLNVSFVDPPQSAKVDRSWLSNASYLPVQSLPTETHEVLPPSKKTREDKKHREKDKKKESRKQQSSPVPQPKPTTNWFDDCGLAPQEAYRVDASSDRANLQYSALYSGDIATYRRRFGGQCLGLGPHQAIEWTDKRGKKEGKKNKEKAARYFTSSLPENDSCLYLASHLHGNDGADTVSRRSHAPFFMALESSSANRSKEEEKKEGGCELTSEVFLSQQTAMYNRRLQEDPRNVGLWLEFLAFQREVKVWGGEGRMGQLTTAKSLKAVNERKLAILERALEHNPKSEELLVGHLELLRDMGREPETILKQWRDLVFRMPNRPLLWLKYSEFCRMQFSTFSLSSLSTLYQKSITTLTTILEGIMKSHRPEPNTTSHMLTLFAQFCHCLAAGGQNERAIACYQALVEFNLCSSPEMLSTDGSNVTYKQKIAFFEPFWDSDAPRLGEDGALGWGQWMQTSQSHQTASPLSLIDTHFLLQPFEDDSEEQDPELSLVTGCSLHDAWLRLESHRQQQDTLPYRGPEEDLSDPERAVLFEDVSPCLFTVSDVQLQLHLVLQYLQFLGVLSPGAPCLDHLPHLLSAHLHCALDALPTHAAPAGRLLSVNLSTFPLYLHSFCGVSSGYSPIATADLLRQYHHTGHPPPPPSVCHFITNTCNQLLTLLPDPEMQTVVALAWIRFELSLIAPALHNPATLKNKDTRRRVKAVQKLVKSLLKLNSHRNNLSLWDCCAQLELLLVGCHEAHTMYETVLAQYSTITPPLVPLYQHYCEVLMGLATPLLTDPTTTSSDISRAVQLAMCVAEERYAAPAHSVPPSHVLKARHLYEQKAVPDKSFPFVICHAYFEYLSRGVESACKVFDEYTSAMEGLLPNHSDDKQRTLQVNLHHVYRHQVRLLLHHTESRPIPPTLLRNTLGRILTLFPDDPYFLCAYTDCQQPLYLMGKLRKYFDTHAPKAQTALPWIHALRAEVARYKRVQEGDVDISTDGPAGLVNRIRALLNRAIQSVNGRGCPLLWRLAISFEVHIQIVV